MRVLSPRHAALELELDLELDLDLKFWNAIVDLQQHQLPTTTGLSTSRVQ